MKLNRYKSIVRVIIVILAFGAILPNDVIAKTQRTTREINCKKNVQCFMNAARKCSNARVTVVDQSTKGGATISQQQLLQIRRQSSTCTYKKTVERFKSVLSQDGETMLKDAGQSSKKIVAVKQQLADLSQLLPGMVISCQFAKTDDLAIALDDVLFQKGVEGPLACGIDSETGRKQCIAEGKLAVATCTNSGPYAEYSDNIDLAKWKWGHDRNDEIVPHATRALKYAKTGEQKAVAHFWIGVGNFRIKKLKESRQHLQQAIALKKDYGAPHVTLGAIALDENNIDEAHTHAIKALALDPSYAWAHNLMGIVLSQKGEHEAAIMEFQKAISIDPKQDTFRKNLELEQQGK